MTKDSGKSAALNAKETRKARHRRQEIQRLRSVHLTLCPVALRKAEAGQRSPPSEPRPSTSSAESSGSCKGEGNNDDCCAEGEGPSRSKNCDLVFGHVSMMGRRRLMEDAVTVAPPGFLEEEYSFFAVYDGHGGANVAEKCRERMHRCLEKQAQKAKKLPEVKGYDWEKVMVECFRSMDEELEQEPRRDEVVTKREYKDRADRMMGSTATIVLVGKEEFVAANCGDSRAVLCRGGVVVPLSRDHKPDRADEKERIESAGGRVVNWNGWRVEGVLATSRSLGDQYLKPYICSEPEVTIIRRSETDDFLIIGTDGLFDVVGNELACDIVKRCLFGQRGRRVADGSRASEAAAMLAELAIAKGSKDNISVIVVQMK